MLVLHVDIKKNKKTPMSSNPVFNYWYANCKSKFDIYDIIILLTVYLNLNYIRKQCPLTQITLWSNSTHHFHESNRDSHILNSTNLFKSHNHSSAYSTITSFF